MIARRRLRAVILRRRSATAEVVPEPEAPPATGKGRPTPKRSDARAQRRAPVPKTRKEAAKLQREKAAAIRRQQRLALQSGDETHLPPRDAGPAKRLARDYIDSHFAPGQFFFGLIFIALLSSFVPNSVVATVVNIASLSIFALMLLIGLRNARSAKALVEATYGTKEAVGITMYAVFRGMSPRWVRRPKPKVKRGETLSH
jgi:Protein of unknown function (DUF3043)